MSPEPQFLYQLLITLGFIGSLSVTWMALRNQGRTQKREVTFGDQYATREAVEKLQGDFAKMVERDTVYRREIYERMRLDTGALHDKINSVDRKVGGLESATELINQHLVQIANKLDRNLEMRQS